MNRLEKKCLLGSAATHTLLVVVFLFGAAFLPKRVKEEKPPVFEMVPFNALIFTDGPSKGGDPTVAPPPAPRPQPLPQPQPVSPTPPPSQPKPEKPVEPTKPKDLVKQKEPERKMIGDDPEPIKPTKRELSRLTNIVVKSRSEDLAKARALQAEKEYAARVERERVRRLQALDGVIGMAATDLKQGTSGKVITSVGTSGPGGGGPAVANWRAAVGDIYTRAWDPPEDAKGSAKVEARISVAREGTVVSARTTKPSGDPALDRSVERVLQLVKTVPAFPQGAAEEQRQLTIIFDLTVKRSL